jgi:hypothetical protein
MTAGVVFCEVVPAKTMTEAERNAGNGGRSNGITSSHQNIDKTAA